ncbi:MAG: hypothetical protein ACJAVN_000771 [Roseivirga sp.]|jgi:hypothetical protein
MGHHHNHKAEHGHGSKNLKVAFFLNLTFTVVEIIGGLLMSQMKNTKKAIFLMLIFALASPLGLLFSEFLGHSDLLPERYLIIFFAIVAGSFLQISTTIFIESDPHHKLNWKRFSVSILGALAAVLAQLSF